jgi:hypothetical protein
MPLPAYAVGLGAQFLGNMAGGLFKKQSNPYQAQLSQQRMFNQNIQNQQYGLAQQNQSTANKFSGMYSRGIQNEMERLNNPDATNAMLRQAGSQMGAITGNAAQAQARYNQMGNQLNMGAGMTGNMMQDNFFNSPISQAVAQGAMQYTLGAEERRNRALGMAGQAYNQYQGQANQGFNTASGMANNMYGQYMGEAQQEMEREAALQNKRDQISGMFGQLGGQYLNQMNADRDFGMQRDLYKAQTDYYKKNTPA